MHTLTHRGKTALKDEEQALRTARVGALQDMVRMRELGDLSENAGYRAAKSAIRRIDARLRWIHTTLSQSKEALTPHNPQSIQIGAQVEIWDIACQDNASFTIVDTVESDVARGYISINSPVGRALLGASVGDTVHVKTPNAVKIMKVIAVRYE